MTEFAWWIEHGESLEVLRLLPSHSADALVTDPPAGISFMGRSWDSDKGGREQWIAWLRGVLEECRRVMKPGAYGWVWALPRTSHWTATACEDAGFAVRDVLDEAFSMRSLIQPFMESLSEEQAKLLSRILEADQPSRLSYLFGTGFPKSRALLKPAVENWILIKAPGDLRELRIEENRIGIAATDLAEMTGRSGASTPNQVYGSRIGQAGIWSPNHAGRWPANFTLSHDDECVQAGTRKVQRGGGVPQTNENRGMFGISHGQIYGDADGNETIEAWQCVDGCPVKMLDEQGGLSPSNYRKSKGAGLGYHGASSDRGAAGQQDAGGASRFFYVAKPSTKERSAGLPAGVRNVHTTVKSIALMRHLVGLVAAPGDIVLDPFTGSGTTGIAALRQGCRFAGIEKDAEYVEIARQRVAWAATDIEKFGVPKALAATVKNHRKRRGIISEPTLFDITKPTP